MRVKGHAQTPNTPEERIKALADIFEVELHRRLVSRKNYYINEADDWLTFEPENDLNMAVKIAQKLCDKHGYEFYMKLDDGRNCAGFKHPESGRLIADIIGNPEDSLAYVLCEAMLSV